MNKEFWKHRNVFVTGVTGFLGSWLVKYLVDSGAGVVGLVRDRVPQSNLYYSGYADRIKTVSGDLTDRYLLERILGEYEIDTVFHVAAQPIVGVANRNPISTFEANIQGTWNLLEAVRRSPKVTRVVAASSDKAYGTQSTLPYDEDAPLRGQHPYDVSKSCADLICQAYHTTYGLPVCITRCGNFYGGGDLNFNRIVPDTIRSVHCGKRPVIRSDGNFTRDYFYIEDGALAYLHLAERMDDQMLFGNAFNFSNERPITVLEIVNQILRLMESDMEPEILNLASNEIREQYLSAQKAKSMLGWQPSFSLDDGLRRTIEWYRGYFRR